MAKEAESTILHHLKAIRKDISQLDGRVTEMGHELKSVRLTVVSHDLRFDALEEKIEMIREGTVSAIGFAANASRSHIDLKQQIADLTRRVEKLEAAK